MGGLADISDAPLTRYGRVPAGVAAVLRDTADAAEAEARTRRLTRGHYENFSVISFLLPRRLRQDFCNVYAFCRVADDLGDEMGDRQQALAALGLFKAQTRACFGGEAGEAVFVALAQTIRRHGLPVEPFLDLIDAFEQDQRITRYATWTQLLDYCRRSADPVGRLVLYMTGYRDPDRQRLSDLICTGLQLTNFWQDVRRDLLGPERIYIPQEDLERFGVSEAQLREGRCDENFRRLMRELVQRTRGMFDQGQELLGLLERPVRRQVSLFLGGGRAVLRAIEDGEYDTLTKRPALSRWQKGWLGFRVWGSGFGVGK
jgi:squalene synthase HpnC